tara:strand:- start:893 stop:1060 length:168 start_codon:yes stop_codon:yes gene_type:complete
MCYKVVEAEVGADKRKVYNVCDAAGNVVVRMEGEKHVVQFIVDRMNAKQEAKGEE